MTTSPYNFVPFPEGDPSVFCPEDAATVSHDHPYPDGLSGHLEIELEATTPIYIRNNGDHREYRDSGIFRRHLNELQNAGANFQQVPPNLFNLMPGFQDYVSFNKIGNRHAIPGTSLKGPIRTILQILAKGRCEPVNNRRYSVRDLRNPDLYVGWFTSRSTHQGLSCYTPKPKAAFLQWDGEKNQYTLTPCKFSRIEQTTLEGLGPNINLGQAVDAGEKYERLKNAQVSLRRQFHVADPIPHRHERSPGSPNPAPYLLTYDLVTTAVRQNEPHVQGEIVLTGQPADRARPHAKHMEFVFHSEQPEHARPLTEEQMRDFLDAHTDTNGKPTESWQYWKDKLASKPDQRVPVFYLAHVENHPTTRTATVSLNNANARLHSFGLSLLYRLPYRLRLQEAIPEGHRPPEELPDEPDTSDPYPNFAPDFVSCLLGEARPKRALKGRIAFGNLIKNTGVEGNAVVTVLGGPKPGLYPYYMRPGETLMDPNGRLRGWKFYPARPDRSAPSYAELPDGNTSVATAFRPLQAGTKFKGKVRFHNLRPHELGALVWALTWGGRSECRHRIGMAKPLGYGCAKIGIVGGESRPNDPSLTPNEMDADFIKHSIECFEGWLRAQDGMAGWLESPSVNGLLMMARHDHGVSTNQLEHPALEDFAEIRRNRMLLPSWEEQVGGNPYPRPFASWPDWMLPQVPEVLPEGAFPGDTLIETAISGRDPENPGEIMRCRVISANANTGRIRVQVVDAEDTSAGSLALGHHSNLFDRLTEDRVIAVAYTGGGLRNRNYIPIH